MNDNDNRPERPAFRKWQDVRAEKAKDVDLGPEAMAKAKDGLAGWLMGVELAELRKETGLTQVEVAERMGVSQRRVSGIEQGNVASTQVGTLTAYLRALGGRLTLVAELGDRQVKLEP